MTQRPPKTPNGEFPSVGKCIDHQRMTQARRPLSSRGVQARRRSRGCAGGQCHLVCLQHSTWRQVEDYHTALTKRWWTVAFKYRTVAFALLQETGACSDERGVGLRAVSSTSSNTIFEDCNLTPRLWPVSHLATHSCPTKRCSPSKPSKECMRLCTCGTTWPRPVRHPHRGTQPYLFGKSAKVRHAHGARHGRPWTPRRGARAWPQRHLPAFLKARER